jgi:tetratricopeptide (TPR) repeat protein
LLRPDKGLNKTIYFHMDVLYTVDEKYLQAIEELYYGELPKALHLFNEVLSADPEYARAYYQLGSCYFYQFKNYQTAGYYYKQCISLEAEFPDVYEHYLKLLITLKMDRSVEEVAQKALRVPGVCKARIYEYLGLYAEEQQNFAKAKQQYRLAALATAVPAEHNLFQDHLERIGKKQDTNRAVIYTTGGN